MSPHLSRKLKIAAAWSAIALGGLAAGAWNYHARQTSSLRELADDARRAAVAFDPAELRRFGGTREDAGTPAYAALKERLRQLKAVDARLRVVSLLRSQPGATGVVFLADSAERGASATALPGDRRSPAAAAPGLQEILRTGRPATDGPFTDDDGTWIAAYALVAETPGAAGGDSGRDILATVVDAAGWQRDLWIAGFEGAFYVWILLGLPLVAWSVLRRQHEQREVIRNLSEAMEQSHSAIMIVDLESRIEYANRGLCQQLGYTRRELIGRDWRDFHVPQAEETALSDLVATVRSGRPWEGEWSNQRKDGSVYPVRGGVTPVKHRDGSLACFVAVFDDVTETKNREAELCEARDAALAGDRAKSHFLATMSHEVRTPLNGIVGFTSLLLETPLNSEQREYVQTIRMSTEALIQLTGDILDFARIESGKLKLDPLACDPRDCVEDALDLLAARAAEKKIELLHRIGRDVPAAIVADGGRLRQVLVNLVGNAVKFTEHGEVEVGVTVAPDSRRTLVDASVVVGAGGEPRALDRQAPAAVHPAPAECSLVFSVRDTGVGIAPEHHAKLFRPFTQVDESTTRRYGGTGLGLAICRNLVDLMGGAIEVTSEPGRGSTFSFRIRAPVAAPLSPPRDLGGLRVAVAVRSASLRQELAALVGSWHGEAVASDSPEDLVGRGWDVALIEVGDAAARELAAKEPRPALPAEKCLGLVPISLSNDLRTALREHFRLLVNKPVHHDALFALLSGSRPTTPNAPMPTQFGLRVLVVDDNRINQRLIERVLTNLGCMPLLVESGRQAVTQLAQHAADYDVVLLDLHMPEMDGIATLREIRSGQAGPRAQTMWIIALTADVREQQRARAMEAGLNDYLTKPLNIPELEAALRKFRNERMARKH